MRRIRIALLAGLALAMAYHLSAHAADVPAGNYKIRLPSLVPDNSPVWLVKFEEKDGKTIASVLDNSEQVPPAKIENLKVEGGQLHFDMGFKTDSGAVTVHLQFPVPKEKGSKVLGSMALQKRVGPAELEPTTLAKLDALEPLKDLLAKKDAGVELVPAVIESIGKASELKVPAAEVKAWADRAAAIAEPYGGLWYQDVLLSLAEELGEHKEYAEPALVYARKAEKVMTDKDAVSVKKRTLTALETALNAAGKEEDAKVVRARNDKLPYVDVKPYAGRKAKSDLAVLVELFTGAECPPCVAADLAFDALGKTYKPSEVVLLQYHLHIPGPDPLTNADTEARADFYGRFIRGTPTVFFNGKPFGGGGGSFSDAQAKYEEFQARINPILETPATLKLTATATLKDGKIAIKADVSDVPKPGDDIKLRIVLVEEEVDYKGGNKVAHHHCVVRSFPGGTAGTVVKEKTLSKEVTVDLAELRKQLKQYLDKAAAMTPFPRADRPLELKKLRVVAFVQNDETGEVLQAVQTEVKE